METHLNLILPLNVSLESIINYIESYFVPCIWSPKCSLKWICKAVSVLIPMAYYYCNTVLFSMVDHLYSIMTTCIPDTILYVLPLPPATAQCIILYTPLHINTKRENNNNNMVEQLCFIGLPVKQAISWGYSLKMTY